MNGRQYYGIKFPFQSDDNEKYFVDLGKNITDKVRGLILHVIFTPKGQKLRQPDFGTNLIKYIFDPNDDMTWEGIKEDIMSSVAKYVNGVTINNISVMHDDQNSGEVFVRIDYIASDGIRTNKDSIVTKI